MNVGIIGAGIHGSSCAWSLAKRGHTVTVYEQFPLGHLYGSSHGNSRIVRRAYPDAYYAGIMQEGYPLWHELEKDSGRKLLYECGLLYFGLASSPSMGNVGNSLSELDIPHQTYDSHGSTKVFPDLILQKDEIGIYTPEAGWVHAYAVLEALQGVATAQGARFEHKQVTGLEKLKKVHERVILAAGPWIQKLVELPVRVTLQSFAYIAGEHGGPVWIEDGPNGLYGFPTEPWRSGIKAGVHYKDLEYDPDNLDRAPREGALDLLREFAWKRFGHDFPKVYDARGCLYTSAENEDFLLGRLDEQAFFVSACSGHGFKFGPWIGTTMADLVEDTKAVEDFPRFNFPEARLREQR